MDHGARGIDAHVFIEHVEADLAQQTACLGGAGVVPAPGPGGVVLVQVELADAAAPSHPRGVAPYQPRACRRTPR